MSIRPAIIIPPTYYLDTSAVRHLVEDPARAMLRQRVERLVSERRLLLCTSYAMVEEVLTASTDERQRRDALLFARVVTPNRLQRSVTGLIRQWAEGPRVLRCKPDFMNWANLTTSLNRLIVNPPLHLKEGRDSLRARGTKFRNGMIAWLEADGYLEEARKNTRRWTKPQQFFPEAQQLADTLFASKERYCLLWKSFMEDPKDPVSVEQAWASRDNPWVQLYTRLALLGVARRVLTQTKEKNLQNDYYDSIHVVCASVADGIVTDDRKLAQAIEHLRDRGIPKVWSLDSWSGEIWLSC
ncbi:MAG: hypothetical protein ABIP94_22190 [Planctomycetota bacterium]